MGGHDDLYDLVLAEAGQRLPVTLEDGLKRLCLPPLRMLVCEGPDPVKREEKLKVQGLLGPQVPVVVEHRDALGGRHVVR